MPKSKLVHSYEDVLTVSAALVVKAKETMNVVTTSLTTIGLKGDGIVMVSPEDTPESVKHDILAILAS